MSVTEPGGPGAEPCRGVDLHGGVAYLRRLARAHAAGELATDTFRRKRRAYIEACAAGVAPRWEDVTVPRAVAPTGVGQPSVQARPAPGRWRRWCRRLGMPLGVALLVMLATDGPA